MAADQTVIVIGGPTASGKSALALALAQKHGGVVINADSMQLYAGLPLLTAQPDAADHAAAPHRLYGVQPPDQTCSAAQWRDMALAEIARAHAEKRMPVVVGGTGFYIRTLIEGISPIPEIPTEIRARLNAELADIGNDAFHAQLAERDPVMGERLHPGNSQRLIRAMEVLAHTGKSLAYWQSLPRAGTPSQLRFVTLALLPPRDVLYARCDRRFEEMIRRGALHEVEAFPRPPQEGAQWALHKALGYPELRAYLDGHATKEDAVRAAQQSTRNYAKRQMTWFRHQLHAARILETPDAALVSI